MLAPEGQYVCLSSHSSGAESFWGPRPGDGAVKRLFWQSCCDYLADRYQPVQIDPGSQTHRFEHEHKVLSDNVAGRSRCEGAAAHSAKAGIKRAYPGFQSRVRICESQSASVVEVSA